jgi:soluble lytic murein transglycosylase and related regulatory proteins (some contain lysM/invasin domains)
MKRKTIRKIRFWAVVVLFAITSFFLGKAISPTKAETITVYKYKDNLTYKADKLPKVEKNHYYDLPLSHNLQDFIYEICADEGVPVTLVLAMIETESGFNPEIIKYHQRLRIIADK